MNIAFFCHSLLSDWNNGNAHFLRGLVSELAEMGHRVRAFEPLGAWSFQNLLQERPDFTVAELHRHYPKLDVERYELDRLELERALDGVELVIVHEWNEPELIRRINALRARAGCRFRVLFHDTHHRSMSDSDAIARLGIDQFDGVLAFGEAIRQRYLKAGWAKRVWTFHEAADTRIFRPLPAVERDLDLTWIGNWGDEERSAELDEFLLRPARALRLSGSVHGVRYPAAGIAAVRAAGLRYHGFLPNYQVPEVFARARATIHVPRRPYARELPGIPTIRVFEALASGIPLISAPWLDSEQLFRADDFLFVRDGAGAISALRLLLEDEAAARALARRGRETILRRHTCRHRAEQLLAIAPALGGAHVALEDCAAQKPRTHLSTERPAATRRTDEL